ncbi:MAG: hypothetical protein IKH25_11770 [Muribaculaceae bacterium]|nr:hypothetical protein [Muribaculaceae bacterium]
MNNDSSYYHNPIVEERYFAMDIESLKQYDDQFKKAYETGEQYEFTIKLSDIIEICPRHKQEREQYRRFIRFLASKNITMNLISRKKGHKDLSENKLKLKDNGKSIN